MPNLSRSLLLAAAMTLVAGGCTLGDARTDVHAGPRGEAADPEHRPHVPQAADLPIAFSPSGGRTPLIGAQLPGVGRVRALVAPLSLGPRLPALDEQAMRDRYFGSSARVRGTVGEVLHRESSGAFRLESGVLPLLANPKERFARRAATQEEIRDLARTALAAWARGTDLSAYDNDGTDGLPGSPDDDGRLDLVFLVVETPLPFEPFTIAHGFQLRTGGKRIETGPIHVIPAPGGVLPDVRVTIDRVLESLGLAPSERLFPEGYGRTVSTLAAARLGWIPVTPISTGVIALTDRQAAMVPLSDLPRDAGFWLVERSGTRMFTSRVVRRTDGHYQVTDSATWAQGEEQPLPLSYHDGPRGPVASLGWEAGPAPVLALGSAASRGVEASEPVRPAPTPRAVPGGDAPSQAMPEGAPAVAPARPSRAAAGVRHARVPQDSAAVAVAGAPVAWP